MWTIIDRTFQLLYEFQLTQGTCKIDYQHRFNSLILQLAKSCSLLNTFHGNTTGLQRVTESMKIHEDSQIVEVFCQKTQLVIFAWSSQVCVLNVEGGFPFARFCSATRRSASNSTRPLRLSLATKNDKHRVPLERLCRLPWLWNEGKDWTQENWWTTATSEVVPSVSLQAPMHYCMYKQEKRDSKIQLEEGFG